MKLLSDYSHLWILEIEINTHAANIVLHCSSAIYYVRLFICYCV